MLQLQLLFCLLLHHRDKLRIASTVLLTRQISRSEIRVLVAFTILVELRAPVLRFVFQQLILLRRYSFRLSPMLSFSGELSCGDEPIADVWSCGVTLFVMMVGSYPFEDPENPKDFRKTIHRVLNVQYSVPRHVQISDECRHLISRIFIADPTQRITIPEIQNHVWFLRNLPADLIDERTMGNQYEEPDMPMQSLETIMQIISEATIPPACLYSLDMMDDDMDDLDSDPDLDNDSSGEVIYAM